MIRALLLAGVLLSVASCATSGPERENDTALDRLNGNNYDGKGLLGMYGMTREAPVYKVRGRLLVDAKPLPEPLKYQRVVLKQADREIAAAMTDARGEFILAGDFRNGSYRLELVADRYSAAQEIKVKAYETSGIQLVAQGREGF